MLSSTTTELSTSMPMPSARPPRDMMFSVTSKSSKGTKVTATETGIATAITRVL